MSIDAAEILNYWFREVGPDRWFAEDPALDRALRERYLSAYEVAAKGELQSWQATPEGMLALLLLLDAFPRRMFRDTAQAFTTDDLALDLAREAIIQHFDDRIDKEFKLFFYMPFAHSEHIGDQRLAAFFIRERTKAGAWVDEALRRLDVIQRFGRFPHRNAVLGRQTTPEEAAFLASSGGLAD